MSILRIPLSILLPCVALYAMIGAYSVRNALFDLWVLLAFGVLGYGLRKLRFDLAPLVLALVLGPMLEKYFRQALILSRGELQVLVASPISQLIWAGGLIVLAVGVIMPLVRRPTPAHEPGYVSAALTE